MSLILSGTDGLSDVDGTAATPAIRGTDANTGIFFPAADTIAFAEGGVEAARFDSSGNFGIGKVPTSRLDVTGSGSTPVTLERSDGTYVVALKGTGTTSNGALGMATNDMVMLTNGAERARLNSTGAFVLAGGTTTANGIGITFPATQSASSDANTLDDYEEGTWTPSVGGTATYNSQSASYTKVGRLVTVNFNLQVNTLGTGSAQFISGLPFAASLSDYQGGSITVAQSLALNFYMITIATGGGSSTQIGFGLQTTLDASTTTPDQSVIASGCRLTGTITYFV